MKEQEWRLERTGGGGEGEGEGEEGGSGEERTPRGILGREGEGQRRREEEWARICKGKKEDMCEEEEGGRQCPANNT